MLISFLTLILGWNHLFNFYTFNWSSEEIEKPVKVLSYNVRIFNLYEMNQREKTRDEIFNFLLEESADILCFQEYYHQENSVEFVTKDSMIPLLETPYYHERYTHEMLEKKYFGVATFSKYPIVHKGEIAFENDPNNFCIYSDINVGFDTLRVFNAHLGSIRFQKNDYDFFGEDENPKYMDKSGGQRIVKRLLNAFQKRAEQSEIVSAAVEASPHPVVLCGDLNDTPVSYCYRQFDDLLQDAFTLSGNGIGQTYIGDVPSNRIDYIFHSESLVSSDFTTHQFFNSDHKPISCLVGYAQQ